MTRHTLQDLARITFGPPDIYPTEADPRLRDFPPRVTGPALLWLLMGGCFLLGLATGLIGAVAGMILRGTP